MDCPGRQTSIFQSSGMCSPTQFQTAVHGVCRCQEPSCKLLNTLWTLFGRFRRQYAHAWRIWVCRALLLCEEIGLWGTAHTDGSIILRLLPTGDADERHTLTVDPNGPVPALNIPHFRAPFCVSAPLNEISDRLVTCLSPLQKWVFVCCLLA